MSYGQIPRLSRAEHETATAAFVAALKANKREYQVRRVRRFGPWLFAWAQTTGMSWKPNLDLYPGEGWSLWWLCFELARVVPKVEGEKSR